MAFCASFAPWLYDSAAAASQPPRRIGVRQGRLDDAPALLHAVLPGEERLLALHRVVQQPFVGVRLWAELVDFHLEFDPRYARHADAEAGFARWLRETIEADFKAHYGKAETPAE